MKYILLSDKGALVEYFHDIGSLFLECFGKSISKELWQWAYIDNPFGDPFVCMAYDGGVLVGHYAVVPFNLSRGSEELRSYLSMTTMVSSPYRKYGLFYDLAGQVYARMKNEGVDLVFGFPNKNSAPGFRKRLGWTLPASDQVINIEVGRLAQELENCPDLRPSFCFDFDNMLHREWRLNKPGVIYEINGGVIVKKYADQIDLVYCRDVDSLNVLPNDIRVNFLIPSYVDGLSEWKVFDYQFGFLPINCDIDPVDICRQMIISDVF